jgi:hypothetical protein
MTRESLEEEIYGVERQAQRGHTRTAHKRLMKLIDTYTQAKVLEARIDEINNMPSFYGSHEDFQSMWESERTATLQAERGN